MMYAIRSTCIKKYQTKTFDMNNFFQNSHLLTNLNDIQYVRLKSRYRGPGLEFAKDFHLYRYQTNIYFELWLCYIRNMYMLVYIYLVKCKRFSSDFCLAACVL